MRPEVRATNAYWPGLPAGGFFDAASTRTAGTGGLAGDSGCRGGARYGGFITLSVSVKKVNLPDGSQLWVTLDGTPVGTITLSHGSGTMATYNLSHFTPTMDQVAVYSSFPDVGTFQQILSGAAFT
jgi:hypothetical protein